MAAKMYLTLPSGQKMPALGLGTSNTSDEEIKQAVNSALEHGYRHIDTAFLYNNEAAIGKVLKEWLSSGKLKREELFITTKLPPFGVHPDRVDMFMKKSLENLQLDYVDLYLIHFPVGNKYDEKTGYKYTEDKKMDMEGKTDHVAIWKKMEEQVDAGRAKNIGLSNYNISQIQTVLESARIKPANLQIELHVYLQQRELVDFCHKNGITVVAYAPLGSPGFHKVLTSLGKESKQLPDVLGNPVIRKIAEKYSKSPAHVALRFLLQRGIAVVPKSVTPKRIEDNIKVFDFSLTDSEMEELNNLEIGEDARVFDMKFMDGIQEHPDYPFAI